MSDLLAKIKSEITEVTPAEAAARDDGSVFVDVREQNEWDTGYIPGALHVPLATVEEQIENLVPDRKLPVVLYCARGNRSAYAAKTLEGLGYEHVASLAGGIEDWKTQGLPLATESALSQDALRRYSRHLLIPEVGLDGQAKLLESRVLLIGAGGLGSPAALYLAAAGVGTLGIVDADVVDETNLQRQVLHNTARVGTSKVESATETIRQLNPDVTVRAFDERITSENVDRILGEGWDVIVDGADNFPTRYLVNDASVWHEIPVVHGSIYRFEGQVTVFKPALAGPAPGGAPGRKTLGVPATAASFPRRRRRSWRRRARRAACSACCRGSSARSRRTRRSSSRSGSASR
jgi:molybdopterin/thiamine biosynthesis adenylyltransferase/rhodanese-related sulfurtransferase